MFPTYPALPQWMINFRKRQSSFWRRCQKEGEGVGHWRLETTEPTNGGYQDLHDSTIARRSSLVPDSICSDCSPRPLPRSNWSRCTIRAFLDGSLWVPLLVLPVPLVWRGYLTFETRACSAFLRICVRWVCTRRGLIACETGYTCLSSFNKIPTQIGLNSWRFCHISINQQEGFLTKLGASLSKYNDSSLTNLLGKKLFKCKQPYQPDGGKIPEM
jgi:hypothetical protein